MRINPKEHALQAARSQLEGMKQVAWYDLLDTITLTLGLFKKLELAQGFRTTCEGLVLYAAQCTSSIATIALHRGVRHLFGEPSVFEQYRLKLGLVDMFIDEHQRIGSVTFHVLTMIGMKSEERVNALLRDLQSSHDRLLAQLNVPLADGEVPFDLHEDGAPATGGFADVHTGWLRLRGHPSGAPQQHGLIPVRVAVKHLRPRDIDVATSAEETVQERLRKRINREMHTWKHVLGHRHILPFIGFSYSPHPYLISPWCANGNLRKYLDCNPWADRVRLLIQAAEGFDFLHRQRMVHRDIKPDNILINDQLEAVIGDFGLAKIRNELPTGWTTEGGTRGTSLYMAPELYLESTAEGSIASDVYAFTLLILEVLSGKRPFWTLKMNLALALLRGVRPLRSDHPAHLCHALWSLFERGWHSDPSVRPSMAVILQHLRQLHRNPPPPPPPPPHTISMPVPYRTHDEGDRHEEDEWSGPEVEPIHLGGTFSGSHTSNYRSSAGVTSSAAYSAGQFGIEAITTTVPGTSTTAANFLRAARRLAPSAADEAIAWTERMRGATTTTTTRGSPGVGQRTTTGTRPSNRRPGSTSQTHDFAPEINKIHCVYHGETSDVWLGECKLSPAHPRTRVAIRYLRRLRHYKGGRLGFDALLKSWCGWNHPNILPLLYATWTPQPMVTTPWYERGSIVKYLSYDVPASTRSRWVGQIADGLAYLHNCHVVHGCLTPNNILLTDNDDAVIGGFGATLKNPDDHHHVASTLGHIRYKSPEVLEGSTSETLESDVYSLGMVALEVLSGHRPFASLEGPKLAHALVSGRRPELREHADREGFCAALWPTFERVWDEDPACRPTAQEVGWLFTNIRPGRGVYA